MSADQAADAQLTWKAVSAPSPDKKKIAEEQPQPVATDSTNEPTERLTKSDSKPKLTKGSSRAGLAAPDEYLYGVMPVGGPKAWFDEKAPAAPAAVASSPTARRAAPPRPKPTLAEADPDEEAEECFNQANRSGSRMLTPGELLLQLQESDVADAAAVLPSLFLCLDRDGDNEISPDDFRAGFKTHARTAGLRIKTSGPPADVSESEMEALEQKATALIEPKIAALQTIFGMLDLGGSGRITARKCASAADAAYTAYMPPIYRLYTAAVHAAAAHTHTTRASTRARSRTHARSHTSRLPTHAHTHTRTRAHTHAHALSPCPSVAPLHILY